MLRPLMGISEPELERALLRKGVHRRSVRGVHCADCGRTPLTGETVHLYGPDAVCELCRPRRSEGPEASDVVRHGEHGSSVRRLADAA
ncbi:MAG: hypothetical protein LT070_04290 [Solirubrobacteraceae bacterium]|nr:hypothetical protein [Solirubrobacteraceae bacterium]